MIRDTLIDLTLLVVTTLSVASIVVAWAILITS
jgi:hypothetical protein